MTSSAYSPEPVDLWSLPLDLPAARIAHLETLLSPGERARAARLRNPRDRARFVARRGLVRRVLAGYLGVTPRDVRLRDGPAGRPELDHDGRLAFSVARSGGLAVCAVARGRPVGVDLELAAHARLLEGAAADVLAPAEPDHLAPLALLGRFCAKEAVLKARGEGLSRALADVVVEPANGSLVAVVAGERWAIRALDVGPGYVGALATTGGPVRVRRRALA